MKKTVIWVSSFLISIIIVIIVVVATRPRVYTMNCVLNAGSITQTTTIVYSTEGIHSINEFGNEYDSDEIGLFYTYHTTLYNTEDVLDMLEQYKSDMESEGKICTID